MTTLLPLTAFEELLYWTDRPDYPCTIFARLHFEGLLDRATWDRVLQTVLLRHPLLHSLIVKRGRRLYWSPVTDPHIDTEWLTAETGGPMRPGKHLDLHQEIGLRASVVQGAADSELTLQFHHACTDGGGIHAFLNDLLIEYARQRGEPAPRVRLPELDVGLLPGRGRFGLTAWKLLKMLPKQMVGLIGAVQFFFRRPVPVVPTESAREEGTLHPGFPAQVTCVLPPELARALRNAAQSQDATLNERLARELFLAIHAWRSGQPGNHPSHWQRMMVPMDLRAKSDLAMPAANVVSSIFLDRRGKDYENPRELLRSICQEMTLIKNLQLGLTFIFSLHLSRLLPRGLRRLARKDKCSVSFVFSNMGNLLRRSPLPHEDGYLRAGDVVLKQIDAIVPVAPHNNLVVLSHQYARRLSITFTYDSRVISADRINELVEILKRQLQITADSCRESSSEEESVTDSVERIPRDDV